MLQKISLVLVMLSIASVVIFGFESTYEQRISDSARLLIGLSSIDSNACQACKLGGEMYYNGCKHCAQDSMSFHTHSSDGHPYEISWGKNNGLYQGDNSCTGNQPFPNTKAENGDTYWVEMKRNESQFTIDLFDDVNFSKKHDSVSIKLCSSPNNLKYLRISVEDGIPAGNGGRYVGYVDDIQIWNQTNFHSIGDNTNQTELVLIYDEDFGECTTKTCDNKWVLQNPTMLYVDTKNHNFYFDSQVSGTNANAHLDLGKSLSDNQWVMRFKFHIDTIQSYPDGSGLLHLSSLMRGLIFGVPSLVLPIISFIISKNTLSKLLGYLILVSGMFSFVGLMSANLTNYDQFFNFETMWSTLKFLSVVISVVIIILGIVKLIKSRN